MTSFFRLLLDQLLQELGLSAPPSSAPAAGVASPIRPIAELDAWLKKSFAHARDLLARIKVAVKSAVGAEPSTHHAPAAAPDSAPAPTSDIAPPHPSEPAPAPPIVASDSSEALEEAPRESDSIGPDDRRAMQGRGSTSRSTRQQKTRAQTSGDAERGARPMSANKAA
jgi:hypothetical protein